MSGVALVLAGHGSHISAETAGVVWRYVDRLRSMGVADEITACFWKEPPAFSRVLDSVAADEVVVVPVFTAQGYFTRDVLPAEMGLDGPLTRRGKRRIHLTPTVGEHKLLDSIVNARLRDTVDRFGLQPDQTAAAIIGHGTPRNRNSRAAAKAQADRLRALGWLREVVAVYLDDEPAIASVYHNTSSPNIIALPYFLAEGSHVTGDVPRALGISGGRAAESVNGRKVFYCEPVGVDESICQVILELARESGLAFDSRPHRGDWSAFPAAGKNTLIGALKREGIMRFGQVMLSADQAWRSGDSAPGRAMSTPGELRAHLRDTPFRPLSTSADLPGGWRVDLAAPEQAHAVLETVYPGLAADWAARQSGQFATESLQTASQRQVGMFKDIHLLPRSLLKQTVEQVCAGCVCQPTWWQARKSASAALPCRSACNLWLSKAQKIREAVA